MMREVVMTQRMPPGRIDTHVGKKISNANGLTVAEQQTLIDWIDQGAKRIGDQDPLTQLTFDATEFTVGEPDLVLNVPPQTIPATGVVDYRYVPVQLNLPEDKWLRAIEFVPGDHEVLHHVITYLSSPADKSETVEDGGAGQGENLGGFALAVNLMNLLTTAADLFPRVLTCCCKCTTPPRVEKPLTLPRSVYISMTSRLLTSCLVVWPASVDS